MWAFERKSQSSGVVAQLVEHLLCKQGVVSSSLISSTRIKEAEKARTKKRDTFLGNHHRLVSSSLISSTRITERG